MDCADDRLLSEANVGKICKALRTKVGEFKRMRLLGASESIARRSRERSDLSLVEEQFEEAAVMGVEEFGLGHHGDCKWYKTIIDRRISEIGLTHKDIKPYYRQIETVIQFADMVESYKWVTKNGWFEKCTLTFGHNVGVNEFVFDALSLEEVTGEIENLSKELKLSAGFTQEQFKCLGVV